MSKQKKHKKKAIFKHVAIYTFYDGTETILHFASAEALGKFVADTLNLKNFLEVAQITIPTAKMKVN